MEDILLKGAKEGNEFAFAQIVERYEKRVYQLCYRMTGSPEDAADQTQETFLKAWRGLPSFQGDCALGTWLHRLAVNCCIDHLRREKKRRTQVTSLDSGLGKYMAHYLEIITTISSVLLLKDGRPAALAKKQALWHDLAQFDPALHNLLRHHWLGLGVNLPGKIGRRVAVQGYQLAQKWYGFN